MKKVTLFAAIGSGVLVLKSIASTMLPFLASEYLRQHGGDWTLSEKGCLMSGIALSLVVLELVGYVSFMIFFVKFFNAQKHVMRV